MTTFQIYQGKISDLADENITLLCSISILPLENVFFLILQSKVSLRRAAGVVQWAHCGKCSDRLQSRRMDQQSNMEKEKVGDRKGEVETMSIFFSMAYRLKPSITYFVISFTKDTMGIGI